MNCLMWSKKSSAFDIDPGYSERMNDEQSRRSPDQEQQTLNESTYSRSVFCLFAFEQVARRIFDRHKKNVALVELLLQCSFDCVRRDISGSGQSYIHYQLFYIGPNANGCC